MRSSKFESRASRRTLLDIFTEVVGEGPQQTFTVDNLGLWATFVSSLGFDPAAFAGLQHRLLETGFLNVAADGSAVDLDALDEEERRADAAGIDCLMIPCVRHDGQAGLVGRGYVAVPGMFDCRAHTLGAWEEHVRRTLPRRHRREFLRSVAKIDAHYRTRWLTVAELVEDRRLLAEFSRVYETSAAKFPFPAIHFPRPVLERIARTHLADSFRVAVTFAGDAIVRTIVCFVDEEAKYIAGLVHGLDREHIPREHNLYVHMYYEVYRFMEAHGLTVFDMGRGYVDLKLKFGANVVEPLYAYLKPLTPRARGYVDKLAPKARTAVTSYDWGAGMSCTSHAAVA